MPRLVQSIFVLLLLAACGCHLPAQTPAAQQAVIEVPFEFIHGSIVVQAAINGHGPSSMLFDTGADPSVVDLETAKSSGLKLAANGQQGSGGGTEANLAFETVLPVVQLGGLTANSVDAAAMDLSKIGSALGRPIGGVLGYSLMKGRIVQIDYPARKLRFYTVAPACARAVHPPASQCTTLQFQYKDDILATGATVNSKPVLSNVDTGSNSVFQLTPAAVEKLGVSDDVAHAHASGSVGFNGELKNRQGTVHNVTVGNISVTDPEVVFFGKGMGMDDEPWDLRIGNGFLKDYVVTLDFQQGRITLFAP